MSFGNGERGSIYARNMVIEFCIGVRVLENYAWIFCLYFEYMGSFHLAAKGLEY